MLPSWSRRTPASCCSSSDQQVIRGIQSWITQTSLLTTFTRMAQSGRSKGGTSWSAGWSTNEAADVELPIGVCTIARSTPRMRAIHGTTSHVRADLSGHLGARPTKLVLWSGCCKRICKRDGLITDRTGETRCDMQAVRGRIIRRQRANG